MKTKSVYLAVDLGAESGRVMAAEYDGERLALQEMRRFPNTPQQINGHWHWDLAGLIREIEAGLAGAAKTYGDAIRSVGVDTWGVDYVLLDAAGAALGDAYQYRDSRTDGMMEKAFARVPKRELYEITGLQFMEFNTLYQLMAEAESNDLLPRASGFLFMPDYLHYRLCGVRVNERTIASTSQMLDPRAGEWARPMLERLGIPAGLLGRIVDPGTVLGALLPEVAARTGLSPSVQVIAPGSHDTASAVAAVPAEGSDFAYLSSGTWSLIGVESAPVINDLSYELQLTHELGVGGVVRLLRNVIGLWLVQECRRAWTSEGQDYDYPALVKLAEEARPFATFLDAEAAEFIPAGGMPARIAAHCRARGLPEPQTHGETVRTIFEGLAFCYRNNWKKLERATGRSLQALHIVGGGSRNGLLNQMAADAIGKPVVAGPVEATALGNVIVQMMASGDCSGLGEGRALVRRSSEVEVFEPRDTAAWEAAAAKWRI
jgi:rhamnulokinase